MSDTILIDSSNVDKEVRLYVGAWLSNYASYNTRAAYTYDISRWLDWCEINGLHPYKDVKRAQVQLYARELESADLAKSTRERSLSTITSFMAWLCEEGIIDYNPAAHVRRPKRDTEVGAVGMTRTEAADWLKASEFEGGYSFALACLLLFNGLRIGEIEQATIGDLGSYAWHQTLRVHGKGDRDRVAALAPVTSHAVSVAIGSRTEGPLLLNQWGRAMNRQNATSAIKRFARKAGIEKNLTPHSLRATMITQALNAGVPLRDVQQAAGHATVVMTLRYDRARESLNRHATYSVSNWISSAV